MLVHAIHLPIMYGEQKGKKVNADKYFELELKHENAITPKYVRKPIGNKKKF